MKSELLLDTCLINCRSFKSFKIYFIYSNPCSFFLLVLTLLSLLMEACKVVVMLKRFSNDENCFLLVCVWVTTCKYCLMLWTVPFLIQYGCQELSGECQLTIWMSWYHTLYNLIHPWRSLYLLHFSSIMNCMDGLIELTWSNSICISLW